MSFTPWGVDLSPTYNPTVNVKALKDAGASYAILKVSEGVGWPAPNTPEDTWFARVANDVLEHDLELRTYHLATPSTIADAQAEATWFDRHAGSNPGVSVAYDLEDIPPGISPVACLTIADSWRAWIRQFFPLTSVEFYWNEFVHHQVNPYLPAGVQIWLAHPGWRGGTQLHPGVVRVQVGQRRFAGVDGNVDVNVHPLARADEIAEALGLPTPPPTPAPIPPAAPAPAPQPAPTPIEWSIPVQTLDLRNAATAPVRGASVKALQTLLNLDAVAAPKVYGAPLVVDGVAGAWTRTALGRFQNMHRMSADFVAGPRTWEALCSQ